MKKFLVLLVSSAFIFSAYAGTPKEKAKKLDYDGAAVTGKVTTTTGPLKVSTQTKNIITTNNLNCRSILGPGRKIITEADGTIHITYLEGGPDSYKIYYAQSVDGGATIDVEGPLADALVGIQTVPGDDRYQGLAVNADGGVYLSYGETGAITGGRAAMLLYNPDPLGTGSWSGNQTIRSPQTNVSAFITSVATGGTKVLASYSNGAASNVKVQYIRSTDGTAFDWLGMLTDTVSVLSNPYTFAFNGDYVIAVNGKDITADLDTNITDPLKCNNCEDEYLVFIESTDGGLNWLNTPQPLFGYNLGDYPTQMIDTNGGTVTGYLAGGSNWNNVEHPLIANGKVYVLSNSEILGEFNGFFSVVVSQKPAAPGGSWTHSVASLAPSFSAPGVVSNGNNWYAEIGYIHGSPNFMYVGVSDRMADEIVVYGSIDGGLTWNTKPPVRITAADLGMTIATGEGFYTAFSPTGLYDGTDYWVDATFDAGADQTVIGNTQYHTRINISSLFKIVDVGDKENTVKNFDLKQNYPNPFNPNTTISYTLGKNANVTLKVYNTLGQEVRTLVNNAAQTAMTHSVNWDGKDNFGSSVSSGIYIYRLEAGDVKLSKKMTLMK